MTRKRDHPTEPPTSADPPPTGGRRPSIPALVDAAIVAGSLADLSHERAVDACDVVEAALPAVALGDLCREDSDWVDRHLTTCPECEVALGQARGLNSLLGMLSGRLPDRELSRSPRVTGLVARDRPSPDVFRATVWWMETPVGRVYLAVSSRGVCGVDFGATTDEPTILSRLRSRGFAPEIVSPIRRDPESLGIGKQVTDYLSGKRRSLDLPYDLGTVTPFTRAVLGATATIPFGAVSTYGAIAARIGQPTASRAIGNALGRNPVPLIIPCHRIVRSDMTPGGFVGGTEIKQQLLRLEGAGYNQLVAPAG